MTRLLLPSPDAPTERRYSFPDPDALRENYELLVWTLYQAGGSPIDGELRDLIRDALSLAAGYLDLTTYPLGQEVCVRKLRDIWRARRRRMKGPQS